MQWRSLADLTLYARELLDAEGNTSSSRHTNASMYRAVNRGLNAFNRILVQAGGGGRFLGSMQLTGTGGTLYALPVDFGSLLSVELGPNSYGGTDWIGSMDARESVDERSLIATSGATDGGNRYRLLGDNLEVLPAPTTVQTLRLWYVKTSPQLQNASDMAQSYEDYVARYAVRDLATKDRAFDVADRMSAQLQEMVPQIRVLARQRDAAAPARVADVWGQRISARRRFC